MLDEPFHQNGASGTPPSGHDLDIGLQRLIAELSSMGEIEPAVVADMLEQIAMESEERARPDYLILCLQELKSWADYAIAQLQKRVEE